MRLVILEDSIERMDWFADMIQKHDPNKTVNIFPAMNVKEAKLYVEEIGDIDFFLLDHDLDGRVNVDSTEENTGHTFAKYLADRGCDGSNVIVHSMNMPGAQNIKSILPNATLMPFMLLSHKESLSVNRFLNRLGLDT